MFNLHVIDSLFFLEDFFEVARLLDFGLSDSATESVIFFLYLLLSAPCQVVSRGQDRQSVFLVLREDTFFSVLDLIKFFLESLEFLLVVVFDQGAFLSFFGVGLHRTDWFLNKEFINIKLIEG